MKSKSVLVASVLAGVAIAGSGIAFSSGLGNPATAPTGGSHAYIAPFANAGDSNAIEQVKARAVELVLASSSLSVMTADDLKNDEFVNGEQAKAQRLADVNKVWAPEVADQQFNLLQGGIELVSQRQDFSPAKGASFKVSDWQGVNFESSQKAFVLFSGSLTMTTQSGSQDQTNGQWQVTLTKANADSPWLLNDLATIQPEG